MTLIITLTLILTSTTSTLTLNLTQNLTLILSDYRFEEPLAYREAIILSYSTYPKVQWKYKLFRYGLPVAKKCTKNKVWKILQSIFINIRTDN